MGAEISAEFAIFEADDVMLDYVRERNKAPFEPQHPDPDAVYADAPHDRCSASGAVLVALPDPVVKNSVPVGQVAGEKIDRRSSAPAPTARSMISPSPPT